MKKIFYQRLILTHSYKISSMPNYSILFGPFNLHHFVQSFNFHPFLCSILIAFITLRQLSPLTEVKESKNRFYKVQINLEIKSNIHRNSCSKVCLDSFISSLHYRKLNFELQKLRVKST